MSLTLLVLAAGLGSRFGGLKQLAAVGPGGETVLDYAVFDARRAGFDRVVFVIRREFEDAFRAQVGARYAGSIAVDYIFQSIDALPPGFAVPAGRVKPWGTGHAVWCARAQVHENFAVINADDFYGRESFELLANFLRAGESSGSVGGNAANAPAQFAMIGFRLAQTLSEHGAVSRGVCAVGSDGLLVNIVEQTSIHAEDVGPGRRLAGTEVVSMNCWAFTPALYSILDTQWRAFLEGLAAGPPAVATTAEFYLPTAVARAIAAHTAAVRVWPTRELWFGLTFPADLARVQATLQVLVEAGKYPTTLF